MLSPIVFLSEVLMKAVHFYLKAWLVGFAEIAELHFYLTLCKWVVLMILSLVSSYTVFLAYI